MKPWLALKQLQQDFELALVDVLDGEHREAAYLAVNPRGQLPYLVTEAGRGIGESNAILWHLAEGTPLMPEEAADRAEALQWMFFEQSALEPFISPARFLSVIAPHLGADRADDIACWQTQARPGLERLDHHLSGRRFVLDCGYSIADIALFGYVHVMDEAGIDPRDYPNTLSWMDAVTRTPGFRGLHDLGVEDRRAA